MIEIDVYRLTGGGAIADATMDTTDFADRGNNIFRATFAAAHNFTGGRVYFDGPTGYVGNRTIISVPTSTTLDLRGDRAFVAATPAGTEKASPIWAPNYDGQLIQISIALNEIPTTSENLVVTLNAAEGSAYDWEPVREDLSTVSGDPSFVYRPENPIEFKKGTTFTASWTNTDSKTYALIIKTRRLY